MFDKFTDRARKVMGYARQEAERFNHDYIGTEHVLLGLVKEGSGVAANVLENLEIDLEKLRAEVEKRVKQGPDTGTMGQLPFTQRAKKVLDYAIEEYLGKSLPGPGPYFLILDEYDCNTYDGEEGAIAQLRLDVESFFDALAEQGSL